MSLGLHLDCVSLSDRIPRDLTIENNTDCTIELGKSFDGSILQLNVRYTNSNKFFKCIQNLLTLRVFLLELSDKLHEGNTANSVPQKAAPD